MLFEPAGTPSRIRSLPRLPLRSLLVISFVLQVLGVIGIMGWLSIQNGQRMVQEVGGQLRNEVTERIFDHLTAYLEMPQQVVADTAALAELNILNPQNSATLARYLWHQLQAHPELFITAVGYESGQVTAVGIDPDGRAIIRAIDPGQYQLHTYTVQGKGDRGPLLRVEDFNLKGRPWYQAGVAAKGATWTAIYPNHIQPIPIISAVRSLYHPQTGQFLGVTNATLSLHQVSQFLQTLKVGQSGETFIIERSGDLVASSTGEPLYPAPQAGAATVGKRLNATRSRNPLVQAAVHHLMHHFGDLKHLQTGQQLEFQLNGNRELMQVTPFTDPYGLDWLVVVVVPEADFMAPLYANIQHTILLCLGALGMAIAIGVITAHWLATPINRLSRAALKIAKGNFDQRVEDGSDVQEVHHLGQAFNQMAQNLQTSFAALQERESQLRIALEAAEIVCWQWDLTTHQMQGMGQHTVQGWQATAWKQDSEAQLAAIHPEDRSQVEEAIAAAITTQRGINLEYRIVLPDRRILWMLALGRMQTDAAGQPHHLVGVWLNITKRKRYEAEHSTIERALRESERRYRQVVQTQSDFILRSRPDTTITFANQSLCQALGLPLEQVMGLRWDQFVLPEDLEPVHSKIRALTPDNPTFENINRDYRPDGQVGWTQWINQGIFDETGQLIELQSVGRDVTALRQAELAIQKSEARLREIAASVPGAIIRYILHPDGSDQVSYMSPGCFELWEIEAHVIERTPHLLWDVIHPEDLPGMHASVLESAQYLTPWVWEWRITTHLSRREKWVRGVGKPERQPNGDTLWTTVILDITDRKQAELALRESEARWQFALEGAGDGIWDWNAQTNDVFFSHQWKAMLGYSDAEISNNLREWETRVHPDDKAQCFADLDRHFRGETSIYQNEHRLLCRDGSYKWILDRGKVIQRTSDGKPLRVIGTHTDISDRKQMEAQRFQAEKLRLELTLLEDILDIVLAGYWDWYLPEWQEYYSPGFKRMFGYGNEELPNVPETWQHLIFPEDLPGVLDCFNRHVQSRGQVPYYNEVRYRHKNGSTIWVICSGQVIEWDEQGNPLRMIGCHIDITRRKQAEEQLRKSDAHLRTAQRVGQLGSWELNIQNGMMNWSEEVFRIFGLSPVARSLTYSDLQPFIHPADRPYYLDTMETAIAQCSGYEIECRIYRADGTPAYILIRAEPLYQNEQPPQLMGIVQDITTRKQNEEQLCQLTVNLEASNRELEQFAYIASHDLQEPLRAVSSFAQLLAKRYQGQLDAKADLYIGLMVDGATRMQQQIRDLLTYSRVGRQELNWQPIDGNALLQQVQQNLQVAIAESEALITSDALPTVQADKAQLTQLFQNLLSNAIKYRGESAPRIHVTVKKVTRDLRESDRSSWPENLLTSTYRIEAEEWLFSVQDNGIGIDPQYAERIFGIFQRLHTREDYPGTGLGLSICQKIVERHGGRIWVISQPGQGATFYFTLPLIHTSDHGCLPLPQAIDSPSG